MRTEKELLEALRNNCEYWVRQVMKDFNIQEGTDVHKALLKATDGVIFSILVACDGDSSATDFDPISIVINGKAVNNSGEELHDKWCKLDKGN